MSPTRQMCGFLLLFLVAVVVGCAGKPNKPDHLDNPQLHPKYPPSRFLTAVGMSPNSPAEAEARAKQAVAEQIRSEIASLVRATEREVHAGGKRASESEFLSQVKVTASFSHAELIRIDPAASGSYGGQHYAFAFLPMRDAMENLSREYEQDAVPYREAARAAKETRGIGAFAASYRAAKERLAKMAAKGFEIRALTRREFTPYIEDDALWREMLVDKARRISGLKVAVAVETEDAEARERLVSLFTRAFSSMGLTAVAAGECSAGFSFRAIASTKCRAGSFGPECSLSLKGKLAACDTGASVAEADLSDRAFRGASTKDEAQARRDLWKSVTEARLRDKLKETLASALPLD